MLPIILAAAGYALGTFLEKNDTKELTPGMEIDTSKNNTKQEPTETPPVETPIPAKGEPK
ncbi:MAG: hypothetical protein BA864_13870 [Desulfuromonadales bacterium C00003093]|nr:MAG: hypothetical protein BA864_13870 [Desulfuromonadales bacterium C00003093]